MIKNERQYRITKAQAEKFGSALERLAGRHADSTVHPMLQRAEEEGLRSQLEDLRAQLRQYEELQMGKQPAFQVASWYELPQALIRARIALGLSQRELAERLRLPEQQIQRYEATEYASASLARVTEVIDALGVKISEEIVLPSGRLSLAALLRRLKDVGLDRDLVLRRLLPRRVAAGLQGDGEPPDDGADHLIVQAAAAVGRVFGWNPTELLGTAPLKLENAMMGGVRFKLAANTDTRRLSAYTVYAHYLALLVLQATADLPQRPIPDSSDDCRRAVLATYGSITFEHALDYVWSLGVPVLPLNDSGAFHGACWRVDGRNVIVLKQRTQSAARWLHDLLHELRHAAQEPEARELAVVEISETARERWESPDEQVASQFAGDVVLGGRAEELVQLCVEAAGKKVERLKAVLPRVAAQEHVPVDALANYMAFRLSLQKTNWWGTATNLQVLGADPWRDARAAFLERTALHHLNELDRELLLQALSDPEM